MKYDKQQKTISKNFGSLQPHKGLNAIEIKGEWFIVPSKMNRSNDNLKQNRK